ncbi:MAG: hypothetical protein P1U87_04990 [Verrucomicrobiales bacterium]|nr:hypothetical protein [Verrucomicrobiales bacterium]
MVTYVVVPTFRETELVSSFLESWENVTSADVQVYVVNGNPGDETSQLLSDWEGEMDVEEVCGNPDLFWTGLVDLGLRKVAEEADPADFFVLTNIDVRFEGDPLKTILDRFEDLSSRQVAIPVVAESGKVASAGVQVLSWPLSRNRHIWDGLEEEELPFGEIVEATYLPTRFLLCPVTALEKGIFPDPENLPHYCADYEYTNRLGRHGYQPTVYSGAIARLSEENTGFDTYLLSTTFWSRLRKANDIKCAYNFRYRFQFVRLTYPGWAFLPGLITHFAKIFLEIIFGGRSLQRWRRS